MCKEIDYIRNVINNYDISLSWLARKIGKGYTKQRLFYILNFGKEISTTTYKDIREVLDKHNFVLSDFDEGDLARVTANINSDSADLVKTALDAIEDHILTKEEKTDLRLQLESIKRRVMKLESILNENNYDVLVKKVETKLNNYGQLKPKEVSKLIEVAKNTNWGNVKIKETGLINSFHHFKKHGSEKYINAKSMKEYNSKLKGIIEDPNRDIYLGSHNVHGPQILCYKDNSLVVVSLRKMMLITFQTLKGERLKGYLKKYTKTIKLNSKGISKWINSNL